MRLDQNENRFGGIRSQKVDSRARHAFLVVALLAPMALLWGCSGVVGGQSTPPPPQTFSISGTISPVAGGSGATVTLSGAAGATTTANSSGNFSFSGLANGTYTITPSLAGYTFSPTSLSVTVSGANITTGLNFTATVQGGTHSISGTISPVTGGSGATVTLSGAASATTAATSSGAYTFTGLANGTYTITPSHAGFTFNPIRQSVVLSGADVSGVNFSATGQTYSISGTISPSVGGSGATVTLSGTANATTTANSSGSYTFSSLANGTYTVTPSQAGYTFSPASQNTTVNGANVTGVNFSANGVPVAPTITTQPANQAVVVGQMATFTVMAAGTAPLSYQWQKNGASLAGATASSYTTPATATTDNGSTFDVVVSNTAGTVTSNAATLTVNPASVVPSITSLNPTSGPVGTSVTITGTNFGASQGPSTVKFNGTSAVPTSWSATSIVAPVPVGATTGNVVVTVGGVASNGAAFTGTVTVPSITNLNPVTGLVGTPVTISGTNFGAAQGTSTVKFNGIVATVTSWSAGSIVAPVPAGATTGNVVVMVGGAASNGVSFTVPVPAPSITSLNPASGVVGASVTISGANFGAAQGTNTVKFNGTTATPTSWGATSIVAPVPAGATTGNVVVTVGGVASNGVSFTVQADTTPPVVTITTPANNSTASGTITLTATATDPDSPVSFVQFLVDGANRGAQLTTAPYSLSLDTTTLSNATHSLTAVAQDPSGNVGTSGAVTITVLNATAGLPTLIYSTAVPLAVPSGSAWNGPGTCTTSAHCYRIPVDPNVVTAGSTMVMAFGYNSAGANQVFAVTDDKSDTWVLDATSSASNNKTLRIYRAANVTAGVSYIQVQLTGGTDNRYWQAQVAVFYNVGALDVSSCNAGSSATIQAGSLTPTVSGDLIFQAKFSANTLSGSSPYGLPLQAASFTPGLQPNITWSLASQMLGDGAADQYGVYNSTVAMNPTFTQAASDSYISCAVALQAASAGAAATAIPRVVHQEHDAMPKNAPNPWHVGLVVDVPNSAVYLSYVGNDSISSVSSSPAPNVGWTASGVDFNGTNGHNHVNFYCAQWTTPPGAVNLSINRSATPNDSINMIYVVQNGTCNLDVDSGGQAGYQSSAASVLTTCSGCVTPTKKNDFIMANGGQAYCTATSLNAPSGPSGVFDSAWFTGNTIDGPTQTDENNFWMHFYNGSSLSPISVAWGESCNNAQQNWASRVAAYQSN